MLQAQHRALNARPVTSTPLAQMLAPPDPYLTQARARAKLDGMALGHHAPSVQQGISPQQVNAFLFLAFVATLLLVVIRVGVFESWMLRNDLTPLDKNVPSSVSSTIEPQCFELLGPCWTTTVVCIP